MTPKRVLVIGSSGLLGRKVTELLLRGTPYQACLAARSGVPPQMFPDVPIFQLDITSRKDVKRVISDIKPDVIINAAAMTNVDACETRREEAWRVNVEGVENIIDAARRIHAKVMHISTDYVFDGKNGPYQEEHRPDPINYYGKTKLASENALRAAEVEFFIARAIVLYGYALGTRQNFATWLLDSLQKKQQVRIVDDQWCNPTLADDLAYALMKAIELDRTGVYHIGGRDVISRYDFALTLARLFGLDASLIVRISSGELKQEAARPFNSGLVTLKAEVELGFKPSTVEQGLLVIKNQIMQNTRRLADSAPVPGGGQGKR